MFEIADLFSSIHKLFAWMPSDFSNICTAIAVVFFIIVFARLVVGVKELILNWL